MAVHTGYSNGLQEKCAMSDSRDSSPPPQPLKIPRLSAPDALGLGSGQSSPKLVASHLAIPPPPLIPAPLLYSRMPIPTVPVTFIHTLRQRLDEILHGPGFGSTSTSPTIDSKTADLCEYYSTLIPEDRTSFLKTLATDYGVDHAQVQQLASHLATAKDRGYGVLLRAEERLRHALVPRYQHLFTKISHQHHGVKFLVDLRTDLLSILQSKVQDHDNPYLSALNVCLRDLLSLWFSVGFFKLERVTWESPCDMLQKISEYEAVHPIRNWTDLKRRVGSSRRCFVFTHHSMPREPVVVLHTALTSEISSSIQSIVSRGVSRHGTLENEVSSSHKDAEKEEAAVSTAIFYSITSTQRGLTGVEIGNYLIKSAVKELLSEFPKMHQFSSLSPIPGFREWLLGEINSFLNNQASGEESEQHLFTETELGQLKGALECPAGAIFDSLKQVLANNSWISNEKLTAVLKDPLLRLCARYLYIEKRRGFAYNPVANFHLRNGAVLWRINWLADVTPRGLSASCGMMVNYRYFLEDTEQNSRTYMESQQIVASDQVLALVKDLPQRAIPRPRLNSQGSTSSNGSAVTSSG